jgi:hypothetical protein
VAEGVGCEFKPTEKCVLSDCFKKTGDYMKIATIPALRRPMQENQEFEASPSYLVRPCLKNQNNNKIISLVWS